MLVMRAGSMNVGREKGWPCCDEGATVVLKGKPGLQGCGLDQRRTLVSHLCSSSH